MRNFVLPFLALAAMSAGPPEGDRADAQPKEVPPEAQPCSGSVPVYNPEGCAPGPIDMDEEQAICRDRIHEVREANDQPRLRSDTADPDDPLLIAAVDQRIDECSVMVMRDNTSDVRPIPLPDDDETGLQPAG